MKNRASAGLRPKTGLGRSPLECGGQGRSRTADASLFRAALYHLSYLATFRNPLCAPRAARIVHFTPVVGGMDATGPMPEACGTCLIIATLRDSLNVRAGCGSG